MSEGLSEKEKNRNRRACEGVYDDILDTLSDRLKTEIDGCNDLELDPFGACVMEGEFVYSRILHPGKILDINRLQMILRDHETYKDLSLQYINNEYVLVACFKWANAVEEEDDDLRIPKSSIKVWPPSWVPVTCLFGILTSICFGALKTPLFGL